MYKLVLALRYLRTRWIALASIVSVTLGVATLIVVNAVMSGFQHEMQDRLHGVLSDVVFESRSLDGALDADAHMRKIDAVAGELIERMSPSAQVPAMIGFNARGQRFNRQVMLMGIDAASYGDVSDVGRYLQHPANRAQLDFNLREDGYDAADHQAEDPTKAAPRPMMAVAGWTHRRRKAFWEKRNAAILNLERGEAQAEGATGEAEKAAIASDPFAQAEGHEAGKTFDPATETHDGIVLGMALGSYRDRDGVDQFLVLPGDDVEVTYPMSTQPPKPGSSFFTIVDFYESKMGEYDSSFVFVPLRKFQELRGMIDPTTGVARFNSIQIRCKPGVDLNVVRDRIQSAFPDHSYVVSTWRDKQGAILVAVVMEIIVLNILLFLIVLVAGFGILATFFMIVAEKTRDIGILKSLGASSGGIMAVFVSYGFTLGVTGAGVGMIGGLWFVAEIQSIADFLGWLMGFELFDPSVYYLSSIPTIVNPLTVGIVVVGAILIAVLASLLPAWRAASYHPVEALRWD